MTGSSDVRRANNPVHVIPWHASFSAIQMSVQTRTLPLRWSSCRRQFSRMNGCSSIILWMTTFYSVVVVVLRFPQESSICCKDMAERNDWLLKKRNIRSNLVIKTSERTHMKMMRLRICAIYIHIYIPIIWSGLNCLFKITRSSFLIMVQLPH